MKNLVFLAVGMFSVGCGSFIFAGLLPEIGQTLMQSISVSAQGITSFSLAYLVSAPLFSMFVGNTSIKPLVQLALVILIIGNLVTIISENLLLYLVGRVLAGIGTGIFTPLCVTIVIHHVNSSKKGRALSFIWGANSAGVVFGVPIGLYLSTLTNWQSGVAFTTLFSGVALIGVSFQDFKISLPESTSILDKLRILRHQKTSLVLGISCLTSMACIGLHSFIASIQQSTQSSLTMTLFIWGLGGFFGSSLVGAFVDRTKNPQFIMALILIGLIFTFLTLPLVKNIEYLGKIPFFLWGALGWATTNPQQHTLFELQEEQGTILVALNASAIGLGGALGTAIGGSLIASEIAATNLPFFAAALLLFVLVFQLVLISKLQRNSVQ